MKPTGLVSQNWMVSKCFVAWRDTKAGWQRSLANLTPRLSIFCPNCLLWIQQSAPPLQKRLIMITSGQTRYHASLSSCLIILRCMSMRLRNQDKMRVTPKNQGSQLGCQPAKLCLSDPNPIHHSVPIHRTSLCLCRSPLSASTILPCAHIGDQRFTERIPTLASALLGVMACFQLLLSLHQAILPCILIEATTMPLQPPALTPGGARDNLPQLPLPSPHHEVVNTFHLSTPLPQSNHYKKAQKCPPARDPIWGTTQVTSLPAMGNTLSLQLSHHRQRYPRWEV